MIKSLLEPDAHQPEEITTETAEAKKDSTVEIAVEPRYIEVNEAENPLEIPQTPINALAVPNADKFSEEETLELFNKVEGEPANFSEPQFNQSENKVVEIKDEPTNFLESNFSQTETSVAEPNDEIINLESPAEAVDETINFQFSDKTKVDKPKKEDEPLFFQALPERESLAETARKSGLAYAAAITLFASVVFMLIIGWFADLLFESSPWGKVGGIVLGSLIGFIQLFRITSQIFKNKD